MRSTKPCIKKGKMVNNKIEDREISRCTKCDKNHSGEDYDGQRVCFTCGKLGYMMGERSNM
jgi:hypothetical protein